VIIAARLSSAAEAGQILLAPRVAEAVEGRVALAPVGELQLKGLSRPMAVVNVVGMIDDGIAA
jgi:class 3 adenylate cyclase